MIDTSELKHGECYYIYVDNGLRDDTNNWGYAEWRKNYSYFRCFNGQNIRPANVQEVYRVQSAPMPFITQAKDADQCKTSS